MNNYPNSPTWIEKGQIASGVGTGGQHVRFAYIQPTGRASYIAVNPTNGAIGAWLSGCTNLGRNNGRQNVVTINLAQVDDLPATKYEWRNVDNAKGQYISLCSTSGVVTQNAGHNLSIDNPKFPKSLSAFTSHGINGCM